MSEITVGVRELKARLSEYLRTVKRGQTIVITDHGQPVGRIMPIEDDLMKQIEAMQAAGVIAGMEKASSDQISSGQPQWQVSLRLDRRNA